MDFAAYIKSQPRGTMLKLAEISGVTYQSLKNIRIGRVDKFTRWETAFAVWRACKGHVGMEHLLGDWETIVRVALIEASEPSLKAWGLNKILSEPSPGPRPREADLKRLLRAIGKRGLGAARFRQLMENVEALGLPEQDPHMKLIIDCILRGDMVEAEDLVKRKVSAMDISRKRRYHAGVRRRAKLAARASAAKDLKR